MFMIELSEVICHAIVSRQSFTMSLNRPVAVLGQCEQHIAILRRNQWRSSQQHLRCLHSCSQHQAALDTSGSAGSSQGTQLLDVFRLIQPDLTSYRSVGTVAALTPRRKRTAAVSQQIFKLREGAPPSKRGPRQQTESNVSQSAKDENDGRRPPALPRKKPAPQKFATRDEAIRAYVQRNTLHQQQYIPFSYQASHYTAAGLGVATPAGHNHAGVIADRLASLNTENSASTVGLPIQAAKVRSGRSIFLADPVTSESPTITTTRPRLGGRSVRDAQIMASSDKAAMNVGPLDSAVRDEVAARMVKGIYYTRESLIEGEKRWANLPVLETVLRTTVQNGTYSEKDVQIVAEKVAALMPAAAASKASSNANKSTGKAARAVKN